MTTSMLRPALAIGWFGTSIMEHLEAWSSPLDSPADVPPIGATVAVEASPGRVRAPSTPGAPGRAPTRDGGESQSGGGRRNVAGHHRPRPPRR